MNKKIILFSFITVFLIIVIFHVINIIDRNKKINERENGDNMQEIIMIINDYKLNVLLENNSSSNTLLNMLKERDLTISLSDYGNFEKVGELGFSLPRSDSYINTSPGDVMLYLGNKIVIFYDYNSYTYTKIGKIENIDDDKLKEILGSGKVNITFKIKD